MMTLKCGAHPTDTSIGAAATGAPEPIVEWRRETEPVPYPEAVAAMEARVAAIRAGAAKELVWLVEHPPIYTAGAGARPEDLIAPRFPVFQTGRGGQLTYHGPGQRTAYVMLNLKMRNPDIRAFIFALEDWVGRALALLGVTAERREGRVGLWVAMGPYGGTPGAEAKIAAIGVRIRHWVTYHGVAINVAPDLSHYDGIVPCGIRDHGVTSLAALGNAATMEDLDRALALAWDLSLGTASLNPPPPGSAARPHRR